METQDKTVEAFAEILFVYSSVLVIIFLFYGILLWMVSNIGMPSQTVTCFGVAAVLGIFAILVGRGKLARIARAYKLDRLFSSRK
ncbi:MAG: hypothetical protein ACXWJK_12100 [Burkholderiaceae bacterium]